MKREVDPPRTRQRKPRKTSAATVSVRLPADLLARLESIARERHVPLRALIVEAVRRHT